MEEDVTKLVLNGLPFVDFIILYVWAFAGAGLSFWWTMDQQIKYDSRTDSEFTWKGFSKGLRRIISTLVLIALIIIFWEKISSVLFTSDAPVELNGASSFTLIGAGMDKITETIFGSGKETIRVISKISNGHGK